MDINDTLLEDMALPREKLFNVGANPEKGLYSGILE